MDRAQFMKQLERLLSDISEAEKQEALAYTTVILMKLVLRMRLRDQRAWKPRKSGCHNKGRP